MNLKNRTISHCIVAAAALAVCLLPVIAVATPQAPSPPAPTPASAADTARAAIFSEYAQINTDFDTDHIGRIASFLAGGYSETDPHGNILDEAQSMKKLKGERSQIDTIDSKWSIASIVATPAGMEVEMKMHSWGGGDKRIAFFKIHGTFTNDLTVRDLWVDTASGWRIKTRVKTIDDSHMQPG